MDPVGAALVSLESLAMIFDVYSCLNSVSETEKALKMGVYVNDLFSTEWQQGDPADDCTGEHLDQGGPCQEGELQGQDGSAQQKEQEEGRTGQVHEGRMQHFCCVIPV